MALGPRTAKLLPSEAAEYVEDPPDGVRIGVALSGGGIRSAAFNLGALQALQKQNVLKRADYLAAVSGGNYVASALTISSAYSDESAGENGKPLWAHGSLEERYLRQHTDYLAPGRTGRVWLAASVVYGFVLNYLPFLLCAFIAGRVGGWLLSVFGLGQGEVRWRGLDGPPPLFATLVLIAACCLVLTVLLVGFRRFNDGRKPPGDYGQTRSERAASGLVSLIGLIGVCLVLPALAELYGTLSRIVLSQVLRVRPEMFSTTSGRLVIAVIWLVFALVLAAVALALSRRFRALRLMLVLSSLAGAGLILVPLLSALEYSTQPSVEPGGDVLGLVAALAIVLYMAVKVPNRHYSMHLFYRERLNSAFALMRAKRGQGAQAKLVAEPIGYAKGLYFSEIGAKIAENSDDRLPKLIVCCAVNLTTDEVPAGRFAESFTFEHDRSGGPIFGYSETRRYEQASGLPGTELTLPSIMAVSGAALSPLMGRFTYPPLRFLMALTNVRLGVWIKNPLHPSWNSDNIALDRPQGKIARIVASIRRGWHEPGALYVLREALGGLKSTHRFIYLTDGGHWENLGLVELLRRRCTHVLCFDASSDQTGLDIGRAIALARSDLGAEVELDPRPAMSTANGSSDAVAVRGVIRYPDQQQQAKLVYARAALTAEASWDLLAFRTREGRFPNHPSSKQMFTDEQFEAYRSLGYAAGHRALELLNIPEALLRSPFPVDATPTASTSGVPDYPA